MEQKYKIIQSLQRAFSIIDCFTEKDQYLTLNEISEKVDLNINTTRGLVQTLVHFGYIYHDIKSNTYRLGLIFINKSYLAYSTQILEINELLKTDMQKLSNEFQVSVRLNAIQDSNIYSIHISDPVTSRYILSTRSNIELPLYASSSGKLLLYYSKPIIKEELINNINWKKYTDSTINNKSDLLKSLEEIEKNGYSIENEELGYGISSIAFPILDGNKLVFTISITSNSKLLFKNYDQIITSLSKLAEKGHKHLLNYKNHYETKNIEF